MSAVRRFQRVLAVSLGRRKRQRNLLTYVWLIPALVVVSLFTIYPIAYSVDLAVHKNLLTRPGQNPYVGIKNFVDVLSNPALHRSLMATAEFTLFSVVGVAVLGVLIAMLLNQRFAGAKVLQVLILIPWAVPPVMAGIIWLWMFRGDVGIINGVLYSLGLIDTYHSFFGDPTGAKLAVFVARLWKDVPLATILLLAALQVIPKELYEATKIDGGGDWAQFRFITFAFLRPTLMVILILETIISFVTFDLIAVMTGGGPADATKYIAWYTYQEIFTNLNLGRGAALAFIIAVLTLVVALAYFFALRAKGTYAD